MKLTNQTACFITCNVVALILLYIGNLDTAFTYNAASFVIAALKGEQQ